MATEILRTNERKLIKGPQSMGACVTGSHPGPVDRGPCMHNETEQYLGWVRQRLGPQYFAHHLLTQFASLELPGLFL